MNPDTRTVVVGKYQSTIEANLARNFLESEGIPCFLGDELSKQSLNWYSFVRVTLYVDEADAARATALLAEVEMNATLDDDWESIAEQTAVCTLCGEPLLSEEVVCSTCSTPRDGVRPADGR